MARILSSIMVALLLSAAAGPAQAAAPGKLQPMNFLPAIAGDYIPMRARSNGHQYHIYVRLPEGYKADAKQRYPVVYLLDGDSLFPILAANHLFLTYDDRIPEAVVVGIAYGSFAKPTNRRHIDFMPSAAGIAPQEAGSSAFQTFLRSQLIPAVEQRYRVDPGRRILFGQSRGGAFVLYSAFTEPDMFWARVASNPSIEPGRDIWFGSPAAAKRKDLRLFVASGTRDRPDGRKAVLEWFKHWQARPAAPWALKGADIHGGTHAANSADVYRAAMRWLFADPPPSN